MEVANILASKWRTPDHQDQLQLPRPDERGRFGRYGGQYVAETVMPALQQLDRSLTSLMCTQPAFLAELRCLLRDYAGRETPLYFAQRLTHHHHAAADRTRAQRLPLGRGEDDEAGGPLIYLKREDLTHTSSHCINNTLAQSLLAARLGRRRIVTETASGAHGIAAAAAAAAAARLGLHCIIYMGARDIARFSLAASHMTIMGADLRPVHSGSASLKDATSEAMRDLVTNIDTTHYIGSVVGPHPFPKLVRDFQAVIGQETRRQAIERWGSKPQVLLACVGRGSNAIGLFHEFIDDEEVRLIGIEAGGRRDTINGTYRQTGMHASTLTKGELGVFHGAMSYLLQDDDGNIERTHSISPDLNYPCVGPEHSFLKDMGRVEYYSVTDEEAVGACMRLARLEGIVPSLATSHALAFLERLCPALEPQARVVVNCSGSGEADLPYIMQQYRSLKTSTP